MSAENARTALPKPTEAEMEILQVLWDRGSCTVRDVHVALDKPTGYTTVLKLLQIMTDKGLVERNETQRAHLYFPRLPQEQTQRQMVGDLVERVFGGSAAGLLLQLLENSPAGDGEIAELRRMLDEHERRQKDGRA